MGTPPLPLVVYFDALNLTDKTAIERAEAEVNGNVLFSVSFDDGQSWKYISNENTWVNAETESEGMTMATMHSVNTEKWAEVFTATSLKVRCALMDVDSIVSSVYFKLV
jgi:hypothetical protein